MNKVKKVIFHLRNFHLLKNIILKILYKIQIDILIEIMKNIHGI